LNNHYRRPADHFVLHREHLFTHLWTFYTTALQLLHPLHFGCKQCIIHDEFPHNSDISVKRVKNCVNFTAGRILSRRIHHNSPNRDKHNH
jgi:hypothetical protein